MMERLQKEWWKDRTTILHLGASDFYFKSFVAFLCLFCRIHEVGNRSNLGFWGKLDYTEETKQIRREIVIQDDPKWHEGYALCHQICSLLADRRGPVCLTLLPVTWDCW